VAPGRKAKKQKAAKMSFIHLNKGTLSNAAISGRRRGTIRTLRGNLTPPIRKKRSERSPARVGGENNHHKKKSSRGGKEKITARVMDRRRELIKVGRGGSEAAGKTSKGSNSARNGEPPKGKGVKARAASERRGGGRASMVLLSITPGNRGEGRIPGPPDVQLNLEERKEIETLVGEGNRKELLHPGEKKRRRGASSLRDQKKTEGGESKKAPRQVGGEKEGAGVR